jgi:cytochrome c551/c552
MEQVRTTTGRAGSPVPAAAPTPAEAGDALLASYPHVGGCASCRRYAADWVGLRPSSEIVTAVLAYHESSHTFDPLTTASQHFAGPA